MRPSVTVLVAVLATSVTSSACGGEPPLDSPDGGTNDDAAIDSDGGTIAAPASPSFLPCASGWREVDASGVTACDPWPETGVEECAVGQAHFPGEPGCRAVGSACPAGEWPEDLPDDAQVVFVRAGAVAGDGTRAAPFGTLRDGLGAADVNEIVALARGTYEGGVVVPPLVTIRGACADGTSITGAPSTARAVLLLENAGARVRDVRVGGPVYGIVVSNATGIELEGVVVDAASDVGLFASGGDLVARDIVVRGTLPDSAGRFGIGVLAIDGARVEIARAVVDENRTAGISIDAGSVVHIADAVVRRTSEQLVSGTLGRGVSLQFGASAVLDRVVVEQNTEVAVFAGEGGAAIVMRDAVVRDTRPQMDGTGGRGVAIATDATATLERVRIDSCRETGLHVIQRSHVVASDVIVRGTRPQLADSLFGFGIAVLDASFEADRVIVADNTAAGIAVEGFFGPAAATFRDLVVRDTLAAEAPTPGWFGRGINVQRDALATFERALVERNHDLGVSVSDGARVSLGDVDVSDTAERACVATTCPDNGAGTAVAVFAAGHVDVSRFRFRRSALMGLQLARDGTADLHEGEITHNVIGANVQSAGYDLARLMDRVLYRDNGANFDSSELPVPEPVTF